MPVTFRPGLRAPHSPVTRPRARLGRALAAVTAPVSVDWYSNVAVWPMLLNDRLGDCTEAMVGHAIQAASTYGAGTTVTVTDDDVLAAYERVSGYRPGDPSTDVGAVLQDVYDDWRRVGVGGHKALAFGELDVANLDEIRRAIYAFGAAGLGITVTERMMDDFNGGKPWTRTGGQTLGGHAIVAVGYDDTGVWVITWGQVIQMTWTLFRKVVEEAWAAVLPEWFSAAGRDPVGEDLHALGEELAALTGEPNPWPQPNPTPTPPAPVDLLQQLAQLVRQAEAAAERGFHDVIAFLDQHGL
ncbi:hypothetical protein [Actinoallomurus sp. NPDC052274]|uniref:hypothetical protein n=1 Tax=Actinoallomurus sp. NPDC052274 TaxID=3155420 RepID=UPI00344AD2B1